MSQPTLASVRELANQIGKHALVRNLRLDVEVSKPATATEPIKLRRRYIFAYTIDGLTREKTIGDYASRTLSAVMVEADRLRTLVKTGIDPIRDEQRIREQNIADARKPKPMTFGQVCRPLV